MAENSRKNEFFERESIAIIAILAGILMPALSQARERARTSTCTNNLKTMMLAYQQYLDNNNGIGPTSGSSNTHPSYSFLLRHGKYMTNFKASHCPKTDPIAYIRFKKMNDGNGLTSHKNYLGKAQYSGYADWAERMAIDEFSYAANYKCYQSIEGKTGESIVGDGAAIKATTTNSSGSTSTDFCWLVAGKVKKPGTMLVLADGAHVNKAKIEFRSVHYSRMYYRTGSTYATGTPFDTHREQSINAGWLDGHVSLADKGELVRNFINDPTKYAFYSELP